MKKIFLFITVLGFLLSGCVNDGINANEDFAGDSLSGSGLIVRASNVEPVTGSSMATGDVEGPVIFTGNDIEWFNETTREIRFKNNVSMKAAFSNVQAIKFFIDGEYLFSSVVYVISLSSQIINSLVLYYNVMENKYYLLDGYPPDSSILENAGAEDTRGDNMQAISSEWNRFINRLKEDGKLKN